jgi:hypothetical protein
MAVGRVTAGILPRAKRGEEREDESRSAGLDLLVGNQLINFGLKTALSSILHKYPQNRSRTSILFRFHFSKYRIQPSRPGVLLSS